MRCGWQSSQALSRAATACGTLALAALVAAVGSSAWALTAEPAPGSDALSFSVGLWQVCPTSRNGSAAEPEPCSLIKYTVWDDLKHSDLGVWTPLDFTPAFVSRMRMCTPFEAGGVVLLLVATVFGLLGHYHADHKTLVACGLFILAGLSLGGGLVIFASVLSDAYSDYPRRAGSHGSPFDYRYGWSFFAAGAAFLLAEAAAVLSMSAYLRRLPLQPPGPCDAAPRPLLAAPDVCHAPDAASATGAGFAGVTVPITVRPRYWTLQPPLRGRPAPPASFYTLERDKV